MLNEKPNNEFYWRNKLDELKNLPGESFNKETAWNRLDQRLHHKSSKKKFAWYWAAAAVLLFVLIVPFLTRQKKEPAISKKEALTNQPKKVVTASSGNDKRNMVEIVNNDSSKKKDFIVLEKPDKINRNIINDLRLTDTVSNQVAQENLLGTLQPTDSTQKNIVLAELPQKKKLKVVHINELGDADKEQPATVRNADTHAFQLKFANQEVFAGQTVNSKTTGFIILKTKNSTN